MNWITLFKVSYVIVKLHNSSHLLNVYLNNAIWQGFTEGVIQAVLFAVLCFKSGLVTPSGPRGPPTFTFVRSKKKKERQSKKRKSFKAETIKKRLSTRSTCYFFSHNRASRIKKVFLLANHGGRQYFSVFHGSSPWNPFHRPCKWSVKNHCVKKILKEIWETFLYENNRNYNSCKVNYKVTCIPFLSFRKNQKQESNFQQVGSIVTRNISVFCSQQVALFFRGIPNSTDFHKRIFWHVIHAHVIVPW